MRKSRAEAMAKVLGGEVVSGMTSRAWAVGVTRPDGRYVLVEDDAGARYFDRYACDVGYHTFGSDPKGEIDAEEWGVSPTHFDFVSGMARLLGARLIHTGGNCHVAVFDRADGKVAMFNDEVGSIFDSRESYERKLASGDDDCGDDGFWHYFDEGDRG